MRFPLLVAPAFVLFATGVSVRDAEAIRLGPLQVHPYMDFSVNYDDNVFVSSANKIDDWYFLTSPGVLLQLRQRDNQFELEYKVDIFRYAHTGWMDSRLGGKSVKVNDVEDHFLRGAAYLNFSRLAVKIDDLATRGHEARGSQNFNLTGTLNQYWNNTMNAEVSYKLTDRFSVAVDYTSFYVNYMLAQNDYRDRDENGVSAKVSYKFLPKTSAVVEGIYKNIYHFNNSAGITAQTLNSDEYWLMVGVTWDITAKSTGTVMAGYEWKEFQYPGKKGFASPVYQVALEHHFTPKTSITVMGSRMASETDTPQASYNTTTSGSLMMTFKPISKLTIKPYVSLTNSHYSDVTTSSDGDANRSRDNLWVGGLDASYDMNKWLTVGLGYTHTKRASTLPVNDYTDNSMKLQLKATL